MREHCTFCGAELFTSASDEADRFRCAHARCGADCVRADCVRADGKTCEEPRS